MDIHTPHTEGTPLAPTFYDGPTQARDDVRIQIRFFTYNTPEGLVTAVMEHSSRTHDKTPQETLQFWRDLSREQEWLEKWRDIFIPTLKELACKS